MTERYHRNPDKPASEDIAERVFYVTEDKYQLTYHLEDDKITANTRDMNKPAAVCTPKEGVVVTLTADMTRAYRVGNVVLFDISLFQGTFAWYLIASHGGNKLPSVSFERRVSLHLVVLGYSLQAGARLHGAPN